MNPSALASWPEIYLYPPLLTLGLWVGLTGGLLALNQRGPRAGRIALLLGLPLLLLAHRELHLTRDDLSVWGGYRAFAAGTLIWAWHELAFYSGVLRGPWRGPCPPLARGLRRFGYALGTHLYHELAVLVELALIAALIGGGPNAMGLLAFLLSWALQQSAKLNVLLGVPRLQVELFPPHLRYLGSYWARRGPSAFFLPSVSVATLLALLCWLSSASHQGDPAAARLTLVGSLLALGAAEHWLLLLPPPRPAEAPAPVAE